MEMAPDVGRKVPGAPAGGRRVERRGTSSESSNIRNNNQPAASRRGASHCGWVGLSDGHVAWHASLTHCIPEGVDGLCTARPRNLVTLDHEFVQADGLPSCRPACRYVVNL